MRFFLILTLFFSFNLNASLKKLCLSGNAYACKEVGGSFLKKGCDLKYGKACSLWGVHLIKNEKNTSKGIKYIQRGCELNDGDACSDYGAYVHRNGDIDSARLLYFKACLLKSGNGCFNLAVLNEVAGYDKRALENYGKACDLDSSKGCVNYGHILEKKENKIQEAIHPYKKACKSGDAFGCRNLALLFKKHIHLGPYKVYLKKACDLKDIGLCRSLKCEDGDPESCKLLKIK